MTSRLTDADRRVTDQARDLDMCDDAERIVRDSGSKQEWNTAFDYVINNLVGRK